MTGQRIKSITSGGYGDPVDVEFWPNPTEVRLVLPWPPSVNRYWRHAQERTYISAEGLTYRREVAAWAMIGGNVARLAGRLAVEATARPPDMRRHDLDNLLKVPLDALQHAGVYVDDSQIDYLLIRRAEPTKGGKLEVVVTEMQPPE